MAPQQLNFTPPPTPPEMYTDASTDEQVTNSKLCPIASKLCPIATTAAYATSARLAKMSYLSRRQSTPESVKGIRRDVRIDRWLDASLSPHKSHAVDSAHPHSAHPCSKACERPDGSVIKYRHWSVQSAGHRPKTPPGHCSFKKCRKSCQACSSSP